MITVVKKITLTFLMPVFIGDLAFAQGPPAPAEVYNTLDRSQTEREDPPIPSAEGPDSTGGDSRDDYGAVRRLKQEAVLRLSALVEKAAADQTDPQQRIGEIATILDRYARHLEVDSKAQDRSAPSETGRASPTSLPEADAQPCPAPPSRRTNTPSEESTSVTAHQVCRPKLPDPALPQRAEWAAILRKVASYLERSLNSSAEGAE